MSVELLTSPRPDATRRADTSDDESPLAAASPDETRLSHEGARSSAGDDRPKPNVGADVSLLTDKTPPWLRASRRLAAMVALVGVVFWFFAVKPLWHTDLWGHLAYGQVLITEGLASTEPLMPLARGVPYINTAWLSQLILLGVGHTLGGAGLQGLAGILAATMVALVTGPILARTGRLYLAVSAGLAFALLCYTDLAVLRPQLFGLVCFLAAWALWQSVSCGPQAKPARQVWWQLPLVFALWANLHGSFIVGLLVAAALVVGRMVDLVWRTRQVRVLLHDRKLGQLILLTQLCAFATLLNPYGYHLWAEVLTFSQNPNLEVLTEWHPLTLRAREGQLFAVVSLITLAVLRFSPRRLQTCEVLLLVGLACLGWWNVRMIVWWFPIALTIIALHLAAILTKARFVVQPSPRAGKWSVVVVGLVWIFFGFSPLGMRVLHGRQPGPDRLYSEFTPVELVEYLKEKPPVGLVFNPYEWGDYLLWAGPPGVQVFVNSHAHLVPREVWRDYLTVVDMGSGWSEILDRYSVNTVVLDKQFRDGLIRRMKEETAWKLVYEDARGAVFKRRLIIDR